MCGREATAVAEVEGEIVTMEVGGFFLTRTIFLAVVAVVCGFASAASLFENSVPKKKECRP